MLGAACEGNVLSVRFKAVIERRLRNRDGGAPAHR